MQRGLKVGTAPKLKKYGERRPSVFLFVTFFSHVYRCSNNYCPWGWVRVFPGYFLNINSSLLSVSTEAWSGGTFVNTRICRLVIFFFDYARIQKNWTKKNRLDKGGWWLNGLKRSCHTNRSLVRTPALNRRNLGLSVRLLILCVT